MNGKDMMTMMVIKGFVLDRIPRLTNSGFSIAALVGYNAKNQTDAV